MAASVVVLTPNGRRQTVRVSPNTTILQILEEACVKQGFKPELYDIKHHRKVLDTTTTVRFSGIPNNALLELIEATTARVDSEVILGVQLEDGNRLTGKFTPAATLWEVIRKLCPNELGRDRNPVVIYMRQEIYSFEAFKATTLKSLGITGGRAMLRIIHRSPDELRTQANVSSPLPVKPPEEKPYIRQFQPVPQTTKPVAEPIAPVGPVNEPPESSVDLQQVPQKVEKKEPANILNLIKTEKRKQTDGIRTKNVSYSSKAADEEAEDFVFLGSRNAMLFSLETAQQVRSDDLPEDFYELSITDIKSLFRDIKRQRIDLENATLMTGAMRDLEESKKQLRRLHQYKKTVIRVQFPSMVILQGIFTPTETVRDVILFVQEYLEDAKLDFYLFTVPPKSVLPENSRLIEVNCVPGALLYFGCDEKRDGYLKSDVLDKLTTTTMASKAASRFRQENKRYTDPKLPVDDVIMTTVDDVNIGASTSGAATATSSDSSNSEQDKKPAAVPSAVPKWFKPV